MKVMKAYNLVVYFTSVCYMWFMYFFIRTLFHSVLLYIFQLRLPHIWFMEMPGEVFMCIKCYSLYLVHNLLQKEQHFITNRNIYWLKTMVLYFVCSIFCILYNNVYCFIWDLILKLCWKVIGCLMAGYVVTTYPHIAWQLGHVVTKNNSIFFSWAIFKF